VRIVWITPGFRSDDRDWFIPALYGLAVRLRSACDLHVITLCYPPRRDRYSVGGIPVESLGIGMRGLPGLATQWSRAAALVRRLRPDLVHSYWVLNSGVIAAGLGRRVPVLVTAAGGEVIHLPGAGYGQAGRWRPRMLVRWALKHATAVSALSESYAVQVRRFLNGAQVHCTPWGVSPDEWTDVSPDPRSTTILSVGSLEPVKGLDVLVDAFARVRRRIPTARLRLVGDGPQRTPLAERALALGCADSVELTGWIPHPEMPRVYAAAGMYAQSSHFESQGMAVLEAAACGLPVVGTNVGVLSALAPEAAVSVQPGDPRRLADALLGLLLGPGRAAVLAGRGRDIAVGRYGVDKVARELLALYASLAGKGSRW